MYTSLVSDCIEELGYPARAAAPGLRPFHPDQVRVVAGRAHTCQVHATSDRVEIDVLLAMVDATPPDSVVVVAADRDPRVALWGGLMTARVQRRGGRGAVVDGGVRDLHQILPLGFPVFARYRSPLDIRGRAEVVGFGEPVTFRGVEVAPGDVVLADGNGVVVVPTGAEAAVLERCEERLVREHATQRDLEAGGDAREVYDRHGAF
ncbi:MAG: RraA family protein [Actinobacteria bacterium]|nr:RraA family protein [Actinomycetota bacterium]